MQTKLTLLLDDQLVKQAKEHARQAGCSVSQMVSDYLSAIVATNVRPSTLTPAVSRLMGALEGTGADETDYRAHLERKYLESDASRASAIEKRSKRGAP